MKQTISGIRGIFGKDLAPEDIIRFCTNFAKICGSRCVIGRDTRASSEIISMLAGAAVRGGGTDILDLGVAPTPVVFREARRAGAGVVITASHNPPEWNGLKFIMAGRGINESELAAITVDEKPAHGSVGYRRELCSRYVEEAAALVGRIPRAPSVCIDAGAGAAFRIAPALLEKVGCKVEVINREKTDRGNDPFSDPLASLCSASQNHEIGFAFDPDGDRLAIVIDKKRLPPDTVLGLGVARALSMGCKKFVLSTDTSVAIRQYIESRGACASISKVGEANVISEMARTGAEAGGEGSSGGFVLPEFNYCRDGILSAALVSSMLGTGEFQDAMGALSGHHQIRQKVDIGAQGCATILESFADFMRGRCRDIERRDGIKAIIDDDTWVLVRGSNTEDIIRVSAESDDRERCRRLHADSLEMITESAAQGGRGT